MLRHELTMSILRFYEEDNPTDFADYCAVCNVVWETEDVIWLKGFHGNMTRKNFRELLNWLQVNEIKLVKAYRSPKHVLPLAKQTADGYFEINVQELTQRFARSTDGKS